MTNQEAIEYLKGQIKCLKCETGIDCEKCIMPNWSKEIEIEALNKGIEALEKQETGHWIPVSERLPKIAGVYRVTRYYPNNVMNPSYIVDACAFDGLNTWYNDNRINLERAYADNVIAWQENPEPYMPQEVESEVEE